MIGRHKGLGYTATSCEKVVAPEGIGASLLSSHGKIGIARDLKLPPAKVYAGWAMSTMLVRDKIAMDTSRLGYCSMYTGGMRVE